MSLTLPVNDQQDYLKRIHIATPQEMEFARLLQTAAFYSRDRRPDHMDEADFVPSPVYLAIAMNLTRVQDLKDELISHTGQLAFPKEEIS